MHSLNQVVVQVRLLKVVLVHIVCIVSLELENSGSGSV